MGVLAFWPWCWMLKRPWALWRPVLVCWEEPAVGLLTASRPFSPGSTGGAGRPRKAGDPQAQPEPSSQADTLRGGSMGVSPHGGTAAPWSPRVLGTWGVTGSAAGGTDGTGPAQMAPAPERQPRDGGAG